MKSILLLLTATEEAHSHFIGQHFASCDGQQCVATGRLHRSERSSGCAAVDVLALVISGTALGVEAKAAV